METICHAAAGPQGGPSSPPEEYRSTPEGVLRKLAIAIVTPFFSPCKSNFEAVLHEDHPEDHPEAVIGRELLTESAEYFGRESPTRGRLLAFAAVRGRYLTKRVGVNNMVRERLYWRKAKSSYYREMKWCLNGPAKELADHLNHKRAK